MKTKQVKARKMWARKNYMDAWGEINPPENNLITVFVLPADAKSYDAMVEQVARAHYISRCVGPHTPWERLELWGRSERRKDIKHALAAIGITRPPTKEKK